MLQRSSQKWKPWINKYECKSLESNEGDDESAKSSFVCFKSESNFSLKVVSNSTFLPQSSKSYICENLLLLLMLFKVSFENRPHSAYQL